MRWSTTCWLVTLGGSRIETEMEPLVDTTIRLHYAC